ncbi:cell surface protein SprA [Persicobacter diffluens]|uniref:Cell surface protein SprA n=1 Tax=Persicobacter diffluens TaxID=981 RepID=A0AAN5AIB0_9BACT|nr:cell surface protein SprA [Persicobacter diffluens]
MKSNLYSISQLLFIAAVTLFAAPALSDAAAPFFQVVEQADTLRNENQKDSIPEKYVPSRTPQINPESDRPGAPFTDPNLGLSPLYLKDPSNVKMDVELDTSNNYTIYEKMGDVNFRPTTNMTFDEFNQYNNQQIQKEYWLERSKGLDGESAVSGRQLIPPIYVSPIFDRIFGGSYIDITPSGYATLDFALRYQRVANPAVPVSQQRNGGFEFQNQISMNVIGEIGDKLKVTANFDNNKAFNFQNDFRVEYTGYKEEIIKKIEVGNVSLPSSNSLITGAQNLFGVKAQFQFGKLYATTLFSTQRGKSNTIVLEGNSGGQGKQFEMVASNYDENRHFFLGHFFKDNYENWLRGLPQVLSGVNVTRVEVYVLNRNNDTQTLRNVAGLLDMAEPNRDNMNKPDNSFNQPINPAFPNDNRANGMFNSLQQDPSLRNADTFTDAMIAKGFENSEDFVKINGARKLDPQEYSIHSALGYISLFRRLQNDEMLAVAYEYTYNGQAYKVGEMSEDYQNRPDAELIFLKMLRPNKIDVESPAWQLMMRNVYNLGSSQIGPEGFDLKVIYRDDRTGIDNPSLHEGTNTKDKPLVELLRADRLNRNGDPQPDGIFDYVADVTVFSDNGNIFFPVLQPFGNTLDEQFLPTEDVLKEKYVFEELYSRTKADAELVTEKNKFFIKGSFQAGSGSEITLPGIDISPGSVVLSAGGIPMTEGVDYTVDYNLGRVNITNQAILNSGKSITITYEQADLLNFQTRSLLGTRLDYRVDDRLNIGGTLLYLNERAVVSRVGIGDEPVRNVKYGFDVSFQDESRFLTRMVDALPLVQTKETSTVSINAEFAQLIPGTSNKVDGSGTAYIDDFETTITPFSVSNNWFLGATPETTGNRLIEDNGEDKLGINYKRAKLAWYTIDNTFYQTNSRNKPANITTEDTQNNYVRNIPPQEIFRERDETLINANIATFDMAFFPQERGPYNYNPNLTNEGLLPEPEDNWGAITRAITSDVDFDKTNIEYIEFWMMDPFIEGTNGRVLDGRLNTNNTTGGDLYFNLGSVSEDLMKDGKHAFENGLPPDGSDGGFDTNEWGKVTTQQYLNNAFDNDPNSRPFQDVGLDGLRSEEELEFFRENFIDRLVVAPEVLTAISQDPSGDNFRHYLDAAYTDIDAKILERYKDFNGMDGNSPIQSNNNNFTSAGSAYPDNEDLNNDNTISDLEEYYEYKISLKPGDLEVGKNNIVDKVTNSEANASWYLFRIPVRQPTGSYGGISGFKTIRFMRTYLTGWQQPVVLRMAKFQLVGSQWRRYENSLFDNGLDEVPEPFDTDFQVSVVNLEENSSALNKIPYRVPPGISRDYDNTSVVSRQLNEQSIQLVMKDLQNKDARAVFKNTTLDLINYGRLKMFVHGQDPITQSDELRVFMRIGTDLTQNFYEIEWPLKITPEGSNTSEEIWPAENNLDIALNDLYAIKSRRNREGFEQALPYSQQVGRYKITIVGRPELSTVQTIMLGARNPDTFDKQSKDITVWFNELRATDFDSENGWAGNVRFNTKLADLGVLSGSSSYISSGFGGIQDNISARTRESSLNYDIAANVNLDKFGLDRFGLRIPMYVSYEHNKITPKWDPLDPDIPLEASLESFDTQAERDAYRKLVEDNTYRRAISFNNVRKVKVKEDAIPHIYDIENWAFSYAYSEITRTNINLADYINFNHKVGLAYNYNANPFILEPFKNSKGLKSDWLRLIKDFNLALWPSSISVRGDLDRSFIRNQLFNEDLTTVGIEPTYEKYFNFNRYYNIRWALTQNLSLTYNARAFATIDEPEGDINTQAARDSIRANLMRLGRLKTFDQNIRADYRLPLDKIPLTDFLNADLNYSVNYTWTAGPVNIEEEFDFANTIQNYRQYGGTGKIDLVKLYNKNKFLRDINKPKRKRRSSSRSTTRKIEADTIKAPAEMKGLKGMLRLLMMVRDVNATISYTDGTSLPGFEPTPNLFGQNFDNNAPGWPFILGSQDAGIRNQLADQDLLIQNGNLTQQFSQNQMINMNLNANLEPIKDLKIRLSMTKTKNSFYQELFRYDTISNSFESNTPARNGSYSISYFMLPTTFSSFDTDLVDKAFRDFESYRAIIKDRLDALNPNGGEYNINSQDVLIPAFIAAYTGKSAEEAKLSPFPKIPIPNWRLDYSGLRNIPALKDIFSSVNITHAYNSTYSVNSYTNSLEYTDNLELSNDIENYPLATKINEETGFYTPVYVLDQIVMSEQFSPLIGLNVRTKSKVSAKIEYRWERNLALNISNIQMTEMRNKDWSFDIGYTKGGMKMPFRWKGRTVVLDNDLTFRLNFVIRDTETLQRKLDDVSTITNGNVNYQIRPTVAYVVNNRLNIQAYYERTVNEPKISTSYLRTATNFGVQVRFNFSN